MTHTRQHTHAVRRSKHQPSEATNAAAPLDTTTTRMMQRAIDDPRHLTRKTAALIGQQYGNQFVQRLVAQALPARRIQRWEGEMCTAENAADTQLETFTAQFNEKFKSVLHVFKASPAVGKTSCQVGDTPDSYFPNQDGVPADQLKLLFTATQRANLLDYFSSNTIPDRLFNGDEVGMTNVQQRLLMSAIILANGEYSPGSFEQKVHARMCGHWAQIVYHYAGATPGGNLSKGVYGNFDHAGNIVLGSWATKYEQPYFARHVKDLPEYEEPSQEAGGGGGVGPVPAGTGHAGAAAEGKSLGRRPGAPLSKIEGIQPGDWIWYYNANASGNHSVIFSHWDGDAVETINLGGDRILEFKRARVFSQGQPEWGGREHGANLGTAYYAGDYNGKTIKVYPVTFISRVSPMANPAQTVEELLPSGKKASLDNLKFLAKIAQANKKAGLVVDVNKVMEHLRNENKDHISKITHRLTNQQRALLDEANTSDELETVIFLTQRLRELSSNVALYEANMKATFDDKLNAKHAELSEKTQQELTRINGELATLEGELSNTQAQIDLLEQNRAIHDFTAQIKSARAAYQATLKLPKSDPERVNKRNEALATLKQWQAIHNQKENRDMRNSLQAQIHKAKSSMNKPKYKRTQLQKAYAKAEKALPFGLVHPGNNRSQKEIKLSGKLEDIFKAADLKKLDFLMPQPTADSP